MRAILLPALLVALSAPGANAADNLTARATAAQMQQGNVAAAREAGWAAHLYADVAGFREVMGGV